MGNKDGENILLSSIESSNERVRELLPFERDGLPWLGPRTARLCLPLSTPPPPVYQEPGSRGRSDAKGLQEAPRYGSVRPQFAGPRTEM